jgi:hypothetical protein
MDRVKVYGEVFTPITLVIELLDKLPSEVWTNPDLTWFEPSAGRGVFMDEIFSRLLKHHSKEHILNNMLFMAELQADNCEILRQTYPNVYEGDTLKMELPMFDIVVGNPPFNNDTTNAYVGKSAGKGTLWDKFIIQAIDILNPDGYLCFINPAGWRGPGKQHNIWDLLTRKQIVYLHIYGEEDGKKYFNAGTRFDGYIVQNKPVATDTIVIDELNKHHKFRLDKLPFLPNYAYDIILPILVLDGIDVMYSSSIYDTRKLKGEGIDTTEYKYPVIHSINKKGIYPLHWSNTNTKGHYGVPKVILNFNRVQYAWEEQNDWEGKYGMSQLSFGIPITSKEEGDMILQAIKTDKFKTLIKATKWGAYQTDWRMFKYFKKDFWGSF